MIDGQPFVDYIKAGAGAPLTFQLISFYRNRVRLMKQVQSDADGKAVLAEATQPINAWLRERNLHKIERFFQRVLVPMGYGSMDEVSTHQALKLIDHNTVLTGVLNDVRMPTEGWTTFWERFAVPFDVRLGTPVTQVERHADNVVIHTPEGITSVDYVVNTLPVDEFNALTGAPNSWEKRLQEGLEWGRLQINLVAVDDWFEGEHIRNFKKAFAEDAPAGTMIGARREGFSKTRSGALYIIGQFPGAYSPAELETRLRSEIAEDGGKVRDLLHTVEWKYFAKYRREAVAEGLLTTMARIQGPNRTFHTGCTYAHEAVGRITEFNKTLARRMAGIIETREAILA